MQNRVKGVEKEPYLMFVIVVLILSASAIAMPPLRPKLFRSKLQNEDGYQNWNDRNIVNKNANFKVEVTQ
jgi:hypothetical protein